MIESIVEAALRPFTETLGWQAFAYGVVGRIIITYAKNFINAFSDAGDEITDKTEEDLQDASE